MKVTQSLDLLTADIRTLNRLLRDPEKPLTSAQLVELYLKQIDTYNPYLKAVLETAPLHRLLKTAEALDSERAAGTFRSENSGMFGIPILLKDNVATHPFLGLNTTAGSTALVESRPAANARLVDLLIEAGAIILGKTNLSELSNMKGDAIPSGWSAVGGQTQSAYVEGGFAKGDSKDGHSSPSGSSAGSAVAVSAGFAPVSIGTETDGSLMCPAGRAALYSLKPTIGLVSQSGIVPISHNMDSAGPMAKTPYDVAIVLDAIADGPGRSERSYTSYLTGSWGNISIATLDPEVWDFPPSVLKPVQEATDQINVQIKTAYRIIADLARSYHSNVPLISPDAFDLDGKNSEDVVMQSDVRRDLNAYLRGLESSPVKSLEELIKWNEDHKDVELPDYAPNQNQLIESQNLVLAEGEYEKHLNHCRRTARAAGVEKILKEYGADVIIGPIDSFMTAFSACGSYPLISLPLSTLVYNGRPFGLAAIGPLNGEGVLLNLANAWEVTFGPGRTPHMDRLPKL